MISRELFCAFSFLSKMWQSNAEKSSRQSQRRRHYANPHFQQKETHCSRQKSLLYNSEIHAVGETN